MKLGSRSRNRRGGRACETLRSGNRRSVGGHDLRLVTEYLATAGFDSHLQPLHVVVAGRRTVAEGLHPREVFKTAALVVEKGLVHPEVVRIAMDVCDRLPELHDRFAQRQE